MEDNITLSKILSDKAEYLWSIDELSAYLCISKASIYDLVYHKKIPYIKYGKRLKFKKCLIDEWLNIYTHLPVDIKGKIHYNNASMNGGRAMKEKKT